MDKFTVKYKLKGQWFWRSMEASGDDFTMRDYVFIYEVDKSVRALPREGAQFKFGPGRHAMILKRLHEESNGVVSKD